VERNKVIYKYEVELNDLVYMELPQGAEILFVGNQNGFPHTLIVWAAVNPNNEKEIRKLACYGTGHEFRHEKQKHIRSYMVGPFVWHIYELEEV